MGDLVERLRQALSAEASVTEKKMFGGICFLLNDNMLAGTGKPGHVLFRVGKEANADALKRPGAQAMVHGDRTMEGFIWVDAAALGGNGLAEWLALAKAYVATLPPKAAKAKKGKSRGK